MRPFPCQTGKSVVCLKKRSKKADMDLKDFKWTREPAVHRISEDALEIVTEPHTDLWQNTYYHFCNDNAPLFLAETERRYFSFSVKTDFRESRRRFDQCGLALYLDGKNWIKAAVEYENERFGHLGSVVTNGGFSDWATTEIDAAARIVWYRLSRREDDFRVECSFDGVRYSQMRVCHMARGGGSVRFGVYACSPEDSSFCARFTNFAFTDCLWPPHDGQQPDPKH